MSAADWRCLPSLARLKYRCGVRAREEGSDIELGFPNGVTFRLSRPGIFWQIGVLNEVWERDDYELEGRDLTGKIVVDIGGYIGDSALRFAALGATVHVFEPFRAALEAMQRNIAMSGTIGNQIQVHHVAVSTADARVAIHYDASKGSLARVDAEGRGPDQDIITTIDAGPYLSDAGITRCDILKMDCEGGEYDLIEKGDLLDILRPTEILLEYHRGSDALEADLGRRGYSLRKRGNQRIGILLAHKEQRI